MDNIYHNLHNLYSVDKTLRFELIPIGKTKENFEKHILKKDEDRAENFKIVKGYCDELHKYFINRCLSDFERSENEEFNENLIRYFEIFNKRKNRSKQNSEAKNSKDKEIPEEKKDEFQNVKKKLRTIISETFTKDKDYKNMFGKGLISNKNRSTGTLEDEKLKVIKSFKGFTTYFSGYDTNRKNMYSNEEKHTAIAYRLVDENLPKFSENINNVTKKLSQVPEIMNQLKLTSDELRMFENVESYTKCLTQDGIDRYNKIIGGKTIENGEKVQGINEKINLYNQTKSKKEKLPYLKQLYKQILNDETSSSFKYEVIEDDRGLVDLIKNYCKSIEYLLKDDSAFLSAFKDINSFDIGRVYITSDSIKKLSKDLFDDWSYITSLIEDKCKEDNPKSSRQSNEKYSEKNMKFEYSIKYLEDLISDDNPELKNKITNYLSNTVLQLVREIESSYEGCRGILDNEYKPNTRSLISNFIAIQTIKKFLDNIKELQNTLKMLMVKTEGQDVDDVFYENIPYDELVEVIPVYNKTRNYLTQKPYSIEKTRLMFNCPTLLAGWDKNNEESNLGVLLEQEGYYYLGIINKNNIGKNNKNEKRLLKDVFNGSNTENSKCYKKIDYKLLQAPRQMLPKVFFSKKRIKKFNPSETLLEKYKAKCHKQGSTFDIQFCRELIDFYKKSIMIHSDWKKFDFKYTDTEVYTDIEEFYKEVEEQGYKLSTVNVSQLSINNLVDSGKLFLFKLYNKDFSEDSKGIPNLHTIYWKALFDKDNFKDDVHSCTKNSDLEYSSVFYKLNGCAQMFYRKGSIEEKNKVVHPNNQPIKNKNELNPNRESRFEYDIIKDKRFTVDKFQFHVPITLNFNSKGQKGINSPVNKAINGNDNINIIGFDRGERNLVYIVVINKKGEILEQTSLNEIINEYKGNTYKTNYQKLLEDKVNENKIFQREWRTIKNIKELKEGYMSQVLHKITDLMVKYNAIIVLENLNKGMTEYRKKVGKEVYSKFEAMLLNKLTYYVDKNKCEGKAKFEEGGLLNAYQLVNEDAYKKINKDRNEQGEKRKYFPLQSGVVFYIPPDYTSKIDPATGFVNFFSIKSTKNVSESKEFYGLFKDISFNKNENFFEFVVDDYSKFTDKTLGNRKNWVICTYGERIETCKNLTNGQYESREVNLTEEFMKLFEEYNVDLRNVKECIVQQSSSEFFKKLNKLFKLTVQLRNSKSGTDIDYIVSPIKDKNGNFYDSRKVKDNSLPKDADANGAYNIARKGLMIVQQIKNSKDIEKFKIEAITNNSWLNFVQESNK